MRLIVDKTDNEGWYTFTPPKLVHFLVDIYNRIVEALRPFPQANELTPSLHDKGKVTCPQKNCTSHNVSFLGGRSGQLHFTI